MSLPCIWWLLCIAIAGSCGKGGDQAIDEIDKIEEEILKQEEGGEDSDGDKETKSNLASNGESNGFQYEGEMTQDVVRDTIPKVQQESEYLGEGDVERKKVKKRSSKKNVARSYNVPIYLHGRKSGQKKHAVRERGNRRRWKTKRAKIKGHARKIYRPFNKDEHGSRVYRKKNAIEKMKASKEKRLQAEKRGEEIKTRKQGIRKEKYRRLREGEGYGQTIQNSKYTTKQKTDKKVQKQNKRRQQTGRRRRRKRRGHRARRTRRMLFEARRMKEKWGKMKTYSTKYRHNTGRYNRFGENKIANSLGRNGHYVKRYRKYRINRKIMYRKAKGLKGKIDRHKVRKGKTQTNNKRFKEARKRKGNFNKYGLHSKRYRKYKNRQRVKSRIRDGRRRTRKGKKSKLLQRMGSARYSQCMWRIPTRYTKYIVNCLIYSQLNRKQKPRKCRRPEWYNKRFGPRKGYEAWAKCLTTQRMRQRIATRRCRQQGKYRRCGKQRYNAKVTLCCKGNLRKKAEGIKCCGPHAYNVTSKFCWNNTVFDRANYSLCDSTVFNHWERFCFNGSIYVKNGRYEVCCTQLYDRKSHYCNKCKINIRCCHRRCGKQIYNAKHKFCFHECLFDRQVYNVCGGRVIERSKYKCIENTIKARDETKSSNMISRKRRSQENDADVEGRIHLGITGKQKKESMSSACQEMVYF